MRFVGTLLQAIIGFAILTVAWGLGGSLAQASRASPQLFPGPAAVAEKVMELIATDTFQQHIWSSLTVLLYGLAPALVLALLIGTACGASGVARWLLGPLVITIAAAPVVALLPLLVVWFSLSMTPKIVLVFLVAMFPAANTILARWPKRRAAAADDMDPLDDTRLTSGMHRPPSRVAAIAAGLRIGVLLGVTALVVTEITGSNSGLGYFVVMSGSLFNTAEAMAAALVILVPTMAIGVFLQAIEEQLAG
jgi:NitT/TauT family transport system permease protein